VAVVTSPVTLTLTNERPQSWNKAYAGQHWTKRRDEVARIRLAVRAEIDPETVEVFAGPVDVEITVYFKNDPQDADNIPAKLYVDALKGWYIADDDRRFVRSVRTVAEVDKSRPRVEIRIAPALPEPPIYETMLAALGRCRCILEPADGPLTDGGAALVGIGEGCCHA
jgi:Holliday junction resolvase RusA-like endonuclease